MILIVIFVEFCSVRGHVHTPQGVRDKQDVDRCPSGGCPQQNQRDHREVSENEWNWIKLDVNNCFFYLFRVKAAIPIGKKVESDKEK